VAARRGKSQARRQGAGKRNGLAWLVIGLGLGGLVFGYLHYRDNPNNPLNGLLPKPDPNATAKAPSTDNGLAEAAERPKPKYDFYKLLPEKEVVIPDAELDAQARAEAAAAQQRALEAERQAAQGDTATGDALGGLDQDAAAAPASVPGSCGWRWAWRWADSPSATCISRTSGASRWAACCRRRIPMRRPSRRAATRPLRKCRRSRAPSSTSTSCCRKRK
jgi:hypothetical protein